jgi:D-3-phosphoglycerate dehydrogenase
VSQYRVLIASRSLRRVPGEHRRMLEGAGCEIIDAPGDQRFEGDAMAPLIPNMDAVIVGTDHVTARAIHAGNRLKVISKYGVGLDAIDLVAATRAGVVVAYTPGTSQISVAELAIGMMFALARNIPQHSQIVRSGGWKRIVGVELTGKTLGIIGLGRNGFEVAKRGHGLEMRVRYYDPLRRPDLEEHGWLTYASLQTLLSEADFVTLHCPYTQQTANLIGEAELKAMKPSTYLINTARGEIVDEAALAQALREGWIAGAASDAFVHEPPVGSPLLELDNFVACPHAGGATLEAQERTAIMAARNVILVLQGDRPLAVANPDVYGP